MLRLRCNTFSLRRAPPWSEVRLQSVPRWGNAFGSAQTMLARPWKQSQRQIPLKTVVRRTRRTSSAFILIYSWFSSATVQRRAELAMG